MGKIYYGGRATGKTVKLLQQADALMDDGITPRFWCRNHEQIDLLKYTAGEFNIDTSKWEFVMYSDISKARCHNSNVYRDFIDELPEFVKSVLGADSFYASLCEDICKNMNPKKVIEDK